MLARAQASQVAVQGRRQTRQWDDDRTRHSQHSPIRSRVTVHTLQPTGSVGTGSPACMAPKVDQRAGCWPRSQRAAQSSDEGR